jgi:hypothetical protein
LMNERTEKIQKWTSEGRVVSTNQRRDPSLSIRQMKQPVASSVTHGHDWWLRPTNSFWNRPRNRRSFLGHGLLRHLSESKLIICVFCFATFLAKSEDHFHTPFASRHWVPPLRKVWLDSDL